MKVLLYFENEKMLKKSGIGRALEHQEKALELNGIEYTLDKRDSFDLVHVNTYFAKSARLIKKLKKKGVPVIVHGHSTKEDFRNSFWFWKLAKGVVYHYLKKTYSMPDRIITPTPYSKGLIENYDFVSCPVVAISNGIDFNKYYDVDVSKEEEASLRKSFGINSNDKIVMGIGWFFERKGVHDFIELAKSFGNDVKFIWFGSKNKALMSKKVIRAIKHKSDNVIFPGYAPQKTIIKMLHIADCFLFPSYEETEGIVLLEALACKVPLIVRDIGAFSYLTDKENCLKATDNQGFLQAIHTIFESDTSSMVENGVKLVETKDLKYIGKQLKEQYEIVLNLKKEKK